MSNSISIDQKSFKRIAKRLKKEISGLEDNAGLMKVQEIMAQSLGFRNAYELEQYFTKNTQSDNIKKNQERDYNPFKHASAGRIAEMMAYLIPKKEDNNADNFDRGRFISLISGVALALTFLRNNHGIELTSDKFKEALSFKNILALSQNEKLPQPTISTLVGYLVSIPGFSLFNNHAENLKKGETQHNILLDYINKQAPFDNFNKKYQILSDDRSFIEITEFSDNVPFKIKLSMKDIKTLKSQAEKQEDKDIYQRLENTINDSYTIEKMLGWDSPFITD